MAAQRKVASDAKKKFEAKAEAARLEAAAEAENELRSQQAHFAAVEAAEAEAEKNLRCQLWDKWHVDIGDLPKRKAEKKIYEHREEFQCGRTLP